MPAKRAFLSHSSKDKALVGLVFKQLGAAHAHYDERTFEYGESSSDAIFGAIAQTDIFVLFVSTASIASKWVQTEIALAQHRIYSGQVKKVLIFLIDDVSPTELPEWIRQYVYMRTASHGAIASSIRSALLTLAIEDDASLGFFEGRDLELTSLKDSMAALENPPSVLFLAGVEGIGRRTLASRALGDVQPQLIKVPQEIVLRDTEGEHEFYRALVLKTQNLSLSEIASVLDAFGALSKEERTSTLARLVERSYEQRQMLFLRGKNALVQDDGHIVEWLRSLIRSLEDGGWPMLTLISRRMISPPKRINYQKTTFVMVPSLDRPSSKRLLNLWLKHLRVAISQDLADEIVGYVAGHPRSIQVAARLAQEFGTARLQTERRTFLETLRLHSRKLVDGIVLGGTRERLLLLFSEFEYLSAEDLISAVEDIREDELSSEMGYLHDHGLIEADGPYLRLAPYLLDLFDRYSWSEASRSQLEVSKRRLVERIEVLSTTDYLSVSTIDSAILAALSSGKDIANPLLQRCLLPSHLLRVAREFYDRKMYARTIELARRAYEGKGKLSVDAQLEALRLRGLAAVRLAGSAKEFEDVQYELSGYREQLAKRNAAFLRGFNFRYDGKLDLAEKEFRSAYSFGGDRNFHILRELARLCSFRESFEEAEGYARTAMDIAPNPYIVDLLLEILIEAHRSETTFLRTNLEVQELFDLLQRSSNNEGTGYYERRRAHYYGALRDRSAAIEWAQRAVEASPDHIPARLILARVQLDAGDVHGAEKVLAEVEASFRGGGGGVDRRSRGEFDRLSVLAALQNNGIPEARRLLDRAGSLPASVRASLAKKIDSAEAYSKKGH